MDTQLWLQILFAILAVAGFVSAWWGIERRGRAGRGGSAAAAPADEGPLAVGRIASEDDIRLSANARRLLDVGKRARITLDEFCARFAAPGPEALSATLMALLEDGAGFDLRATTGAGRRLRLSGEPRGGQGAILILDETEMRLKMERLEGERRRAEALAERLEAAFDARNELAWITGPSGAPIWRSAGFDAAPEEVRRRLLSARSDGPRKRVRIRREGGEEEAWDVQRSDLPAEGEAAFVASPAPHGEDAAFTRFVNTMSETFAHLKVGLMIFDQDRRLILFNPATVRLFAAEATFLARRPTLKGLLDAMREARTIPDQSDYARWRDDLLARLSSLDDGPVEESWHLADGRTLHVVARPHPMGGLAVTAEDITESVALRRSNAAERALLTATAEFLEEGVIVFGPDGVARVANAAFRAIWGAGATDDPTGRHVGEVSESCVRLTADADFWPRVASSVTGGPERRSFKLKLPLTDGRVLFARYSPMPDGSSLLVFADVTASEKVAEALRERNEALEHADEVRAALVDRMSRRMQGALDAIVALGERLNAEVTQTLPSRQRAALEGVIAAATELLDMVSDVDDLIALEADGAGGESFSPSAEAEEAVALARRRAEERGLAIETDFSAAPPRFRSGKDRFRQIAFNMLADAAARAPAGGRVRFSIFRHGCRLALRCAHSCGPDRAEDGIALALLRRLAGAAGGGLTVDAEGEERVLVCLLPESAPADAPAPLLQEDPLAVRERSM